MKLFTCKAFSGHYLSGCAVILADSEAEAQGMLAMKLAEQGLAEENSPSELKLEEIPLDKYAVSVLFDGNY